MKQGGWIFISHSHQDIRKVRLIRNRLEELGLEPLMFYLKCLTDECEIVELIKREIDERDWFIYADSENARSSKWVKTEREYIEGLTGKRVFTIDLEGDIDEQLAMVEHISRQLKVYVSYARRDMALAHRVRKKLLEKDLMVLSDLDFDSTGMWVKQIEEMIIDASHDGFVVVLVTESSCRSPYILNEIDMAMRMKGILIPVIVGDVTLTPELSYYLGDTQVFRISESPTDGELDKVLNAILHAIRVTRD